MERSILSTAGSVDDDSTQRHHHVLGRVDDHRRSLDGAATIAETLGASDRDVRCATAGDGCRVYDDATRGGSSAQIAGLSASDIAVFAPAQIGAISSLLSTAQLGELTWLKPIFGELEGMFGESATGSGYLSIGLGGSGKDCNNQQILGATGLNGQVYQYTQLDAALNQFQANYANAITTGQAVSLAWESAANPGSPPPSDNYASSSYQSDNQWYA